MIVIKIIIVVIAVEGSSGLGCGLHVHGFVSRRLAFSLLHCKADGLTSIECIYICSYIHICIYKQICVTERGRNRERERDTEREREGALAVFFSFDEAVYCHVLGGGLRCLE